MLSLVDEIKACTICEKSLPHGVNPIFSVSAKSKVVIIGQAPGSIVHKTGIPWDDKSGVRLREWLGVNEQQFYNADNFAIVPMGFCYPGKGKSGDLPPRPECAPAWHNRLFSLMGKPSLTLLIGSYAQAYYLGENAMSTLTQTVQNFESYLPEIVVLPHPSPRNNIWLKKNPWFEAELLPVLQERVSTLLKEAL